MSAFFKNKSVNSTRCSRFFSKLDIFYNPDDLSSYISYCNKKEKLKNVNAQYLFGIKSVKLALQMKKRLFHQLFISSCNTVHSRHRHHIIEINELAKSMNLTIVEVNQEFLDIKSKNLPNQGVILKCSKLPCLEFNDDFFDNCKKPYGLHLFLDELKDNMNFGNLLRSSLYFGVLNIFLPVDSSCSPSPLVSRISDGAMEIIPIYEQRDKVELLKKLKENNVCIIGTSGNNLVADKKTINIDKITTTDERLIRGRHNVLVLGSEHDGITDEIGALCDLMFKIPNYSHSKYMNCLNVSTATGIMLHFLRSKL